MIAGPVFDQTADPAGTLRTGAWFWTQRLGMDVGDDWGVDSNGSCLCKLGRNCRHPGKHPARSKPRENATRDMERVRELVAMRRNLSAYPDERHVVVDVEMGRGRDGLASLLEWARLTGLDPAELFDTLTVCSGGGGFHLWFWLPWAWRLRPPRGMDHWLPNVDTKSSVKVSDKATLPGSRHYSGGIYTVKLTDDGRIPDPAPAPEPLLTAMAAGRRWVPLPAEDRPAVPVQGDGSVRFADVIDWSAPHKHARILSPHEAGPPPPSGVRYSGSALPDFSRWETPDGDTPRDGTSDE